MSTITKSNNPSLAVFQPDIAQNLGAMIRLTASLGVKLEIIEPCGFPFSFKALRRSAMDYVKYAQILHHKSYSEFQKTRGGKLILLTTKAKGVLWDHSFDYDDTIIVGQESAGVPDYVVKDADFCLRIPLEKNTRSLNVVTAAAIALGELTRQIRSTSDLH